MGTLLCKTHNESVYVATWAKDRHGTTSIEGKQWTCLCCHEGLPWTLGHRWNQTYMMSFTRQRTSCLSGKLSIQWALAHAADGISHSWRHTMALPILQVKVGILFHRWHKEHVDAGPATHMASFGTKWNFDYLQREWIINESCICIVHIETI